MNLASMSQLFMDSPGRSAYRRNECIKRLGNAPGAPGSAGDLLRALWAYPLVEDAEETPTVMRVAAPFRMLVTAPPGARRWRTAPADRMTCGAPAVVGWPSRWDVAKVHRGGERDHVARSAAVPSDPVSRGVEVGRGH